MIRHWLKSLPAPLLRNVLILTAVGVAFIYSATFRSGENFAVRQFLWMLVGITSLAATVALGYRFFLSISYSLFALALILLLVVDVAGATRLGAQRWIHLGWFSIQPSEIAKLAIVLALANFLGSRNPVEEEGRTVLGCAALVGIPLFLIMKQPDLGSASLLIPLGAIALFLWGGRYRYLVVTFLTGAAASPFVWNLLRDYQRKRILVFLNPRLDPLGSGYTAIQSRIAVGAGGLFGKGWLHGTQSQLDFVPEHHTDFIFSVIAEELGFLGAASLVILYGALFYQIILLIEKTTDVKAKLLAAGILSLFFFQVLINIGMSFGLFPITGITLPFLSYGGSSLVIAFTAVGLLVSIHKERSIF